MSTFLYALGHAVARHRWRTLLVWVLLALVCFGVAGVAKGALVNDYTIPGTESQHGIDTLDQRFPQFAALRVQSGQSNWSYSEHHRR